jgi:hypothetical protein
VPVVQVSERRSHDAPLRRPMVLLHQLRAFVERSGPSPKASDESVSAMRQMTPTLANW